MSRLVELIRRIVRQELAQCRPRESALGVVVAIYPHTTADDAHNYEIDLRLKHEDLQLNKVPLMTAHMGYVAPPKVDDLVLVEFAEGDINQPLVTGRFYHADERPPLHKEGEIIIEQRLGQDKLNHLRFAQDGSIYLQREVSKPEDNSAFKAGLKFDADGNIEIKAGEKIVITVTNDSEINILADGNPINIECDTLTLDGNLHVTGDSSIDGSESVGGDATISGDVTIGTGNTTTISGNTITGS